MDSIASQVHAWVYVTDSKDSTHRHDDDQKILIVVFVCRLIFY